MSLYNVCIMLYFIVRDTCVILGYLCNMLICYVCIKHGDQRETLVVRFLSSLIRANP